MAYQAIKKDKKLREWYKRIKRRRGSSIARMVVMRKLATIIWHMLTKKKTHADRSPSTDGNKLTSICNSVGT